MTFKTMLLLGNALETEEKSAEAAVLLRSGYEGLKQREQRAPPRRVRSDMQRALERLIAISKASGESQEMAKWMRELSALTNAPPLHQSSSAQH